MRVSDKIMKIGRPRFYSLFLFLILLLPTDKAVSTGATPQKDGALTVVVTWGDIKNTPANDVYVEAYGFVEKYDSMKAFVLPMTRDGEYKTSLPPGKYDVFVSESISVPRCRRLQIKPGLTTYWTLKLENDDVYTNQQVLDPKK